MYSKYQAYEADSEHLQYMQNGMDQAYEAEQDQGWV